MNLLSGGETIRIEAPRSQILIVSRSQTGKGGGTVGGDIDSGQARDERGTRAADSG